MDRRIVGSAGDQSVKGVHFAYQMPLAQTTDGRVARHGANGCLVEIDQSNTRTHPRRNRRGFGARMASANNQYVHIIVHGARIAQRDGWVKVVGGVSRETDYFPTQNRPKSVSSRSSVCARPVSASKASRA